MNSSTPFESDLMTPDRPVLHLTGNQINSVCLRRAARDFHLIEGRAWITYEDNDVIVESGETVHLPPTRHCVIISAANPELAIRYHLS